MIHLKDIYYHTIDLLQGTYTLRILQSFFELFFNILPYLALSILIHVILIQLIKKKEIKFHSKNTMIAILIGSLLGMASPLPTYAAIPIGISLIASGLPLAAVMTFVIASPLINPSVFFLTYTQLGAEIAIARILTAFVISILAGLLFHRIGKTIKIKPAPDELTKLSKRPFFYELWRSSLFIGKYFTIAILISSIVKALVSPALVQQILGQHVERSLLIAIALGVPFYSCGGAAIPFVEVLRDMGMNKGAVLTFFIAGPATKLETIYTFKALLGMKVLIIYLLFTLVGSYVSGFLFQLI